MCDCESPLCPAIIPSTWQARRLCNFNCLQASIQAAASNATSLFGQQSVGSMLSPTPRQAPPSIFSRTQQDPSQNSPAPSSAALPSALSPGATALSSHELALAQRLGLDGALLPAGRRRLQAHALQQEIRSVKVCTLCRGIPAHKGLGTI